MISTASLPVVSCQSTHTGALSVSMPQVRHAWCLTQVTSLFLGSFSLSFPRKGDNGVGADIMRTSDGGKTFESVPIGPSMMLMDVSMSSPVSAVAAGLGLLSSGIQYFNATGFTNSSVPNIALAQVQDSEIIGSNEGFAVTGAFTFTNSNVSINGVALSSDDGASFSFSNINNDQNNAARYSSFPTTSVGFVSSGSWPSSKSAKKYGTYVSRNIHMHHNAVKKEAFIHLETERDEEEQVDESGWIGSIYRSTDGFETWQQVYTNSTFCQ